MTLWAPFSLTCLSWVVQWQCGSRPRRGWLLCYCANFAWIAYAGFSDQPGFLVGGVVTSLVAIRNWRMASDETRQSPRMRDPRPPVIRAHLDYPLEGNGVGTSRS